MPSEISGGASRKTLCGALMIIIRREISKGDPEDAERISADSTLNRRRIVKNIYISNIL